MRILLRPSGLALLGIAFLSGTAALLYQTLWLRWFQLLFGNTAYAVSAILCAFFSGLALGAALFGRIASRSQRPLALYGKIELAAAAASFLVPVAVALYDPIYASLYSSLADQRSLFIAVKYMLALIAMLPAATLLGGTLPPLAAAFVSHVRDLGREGCLLYALNTLGAALGSAVAAFWLVEAVGVRGSYVVALALSSLVAAGAFALSRRAPLSEASARTPLEAEGARARASEQTLAPRVLLAIAFASGFGTLSFEVLLIQALLQILDSSVYSYGAVIVVVLVSLAAGAAVVSATARKIPAPRMLSTALLLEAAFLLTLPALMVGFSGGLGRHVVSGTLLHGLSLAVAFGGPALLVGALVLPLTFRLAGEGSVAARLGGLLAANTTGGILGSLAASFVFLDRLGLWPSMMWLGVGYGIASVAVTGSARARVTRAAAVALALAAVALGPANPTRLPIVGAERGKRVVAVAEGAHGVVSVIESKDGERLMKINNHYSLGGTRARVAQERAGHLGLLLHPDPRHVVFVGTATGGTAAASVLHPVEEIVLVELVPEVQSLAALHFGHATRGVHRDPRTRLVVEDGRNHLRAAPERYDVVVSDLFVPWRPGVGSLYRREHFEAVKAHLSEEGVFVQWLALYQLDQRAFEIVAATFLDVFPDATLWRGDFTARRPVAALVGKLGSPWTVAGLEERASRIARLGVTDRWIVDPAGLWMLYVGSLGALSDELATVPRNTDDWPHFEFSAGRSTSIDHERFVRRDWPALVERVMTGSERGDLAFVGRRPEGARLGALFARASLLEVEGRRFQLQRVLQQLRARVPPRLLARPDPTVADVWPDELPVPRQGR